MQACRCGGRCRPRHRQRACRVDQQQDQGDGAYGLWLQEHRQPGIAAHAALLRPVACHALGGQGRGGKEGRGKEEAQQGTLEEAPEGALRLCRLAFSHRNQRRLEILEQKPEKKSCSKTKF